MSKELTTAEVAELVGIAPVTWRSYVSRGQAPAADSHRIERGQPTPLWRASTVRAWLKARPGQGVRP